MATKSNTKKELSLKQIAMLEALEKSLGIVTSAAKKVGIDRTTHYKWMETDEAYKKAVEELNDVALDFAESKLHEQINNGEVSSTIFYLKTKGKKRGYIERTETELSTSKAFILELTPNETDGKADTSV